MCCYHRCRHLSFIGIKHIQGTLLPQTSRPMLSGVEGSGARSNTGCFGHQIILERPALLGRLHQTSGVRESRVRGGAAIWPSGGRGGALRRGVRECNLAARRAWGARRGRTADRTHLPLAGPQAKKSFLRSSSTRRGTTLANYRHTLQHDHAFIDHAVRSHACLTPLSFIGGRLW